MTALGRWGAALAVVALLLAGCTGKRSATPPAASVAPSTAAPTTALPGSSTTTAVAGSGTPPHVLVVVFENHEASDVLGHMPYLDGLVARGALATQAFAVSHPSLPNYLELVSGHTFGITSDCTSCSGQGQTVADQLDAAGVPWGAYMDGLSTPCPHVDSTADGYAKKHDPFAYFPDLMGRPAACGRIRPLAQMAGDLTSASAPDFVWVTPNLCHDAHDCPLATADAWLRGLLDPVLDSHWFASGGIVIVTFDEGITQAGCCTGGHGGHILTVVVSPLVTPGAKLDTPVDHAGTLATIEDLYHLPHLGDAACACAGSLLPVLGRP